MQSIFHILNGDALAELFPTDLSGQRIIFREMLMDGPLSRTLDTTFYEARRAFLLQEYGITDLEQFTAVTTELDKLKCLPVGARVYLWFEYDLFCQVNFWACCRWLTQYNKDLELYWVAPEDKDWRGFGNYNTQGLRRLFDSAVIVEARQLNEFTTSLAVYSRKNYEELSDFIVDEALSLTTQAVLKAELARLPDASGQIWLDKEIERIKVLSEGNFGRAFRIFCEEWGIYGMGDLQFRRLFDSSK